MPGPLRSTMVAGLVVALSFSFGCDKPAAPPAPTSPVRQIDASDLPALGDYAPPLDGGRVEIAGPVGWQLAPRTSGCVVRFVGSTSDSYPTILVKAEDSSTEPLSSENVVAFASALAADGSALPVAIGERFGALQRKRGKEPNTVDQILERLIFTTVLNGRTYELELRTRQDRVAESQDRLFAVVAGMREIGNVVTESSEGEASAKTEDKEAPTNAGQKELGEISE